MIAKVSRAKLLWSLSEEIRRSQGSPGIPHKADCNPKARCCMRLCLYKLKVIEKRIANDESLLFMATKVIYIRIRNHPSAMTVP